MKVPEKELPTLLKNEVIEDENLTYTSNISTSAIYESQVKSKKEYIIKSQVLVGNTKDMK